MDMFRTSCARALGLALAVSAGLVGSAQAALVVNRGFNGSWYNPAQSGRGLMVEYIPSPTVPGEGQLFTALYTFDGEGKPIWLTMQVPLLEGEFSKQDVPVGLAEGGSFDNVDFGSISRS